MSGRKFNTHVALLSQSIDDFDSTMAEFATNVYILSKGITEDTVNKINNRFMPTADALKALKTYVNGPVAGEGSTLLYIGSVKGGRDPKVEHPIRLTLGPIEMWAYTTTAEDVIIRTKLTERAGLSAALEILANEYPSGIKSTIENLKMKQVGDAYGQEDDGSVYDKIVEDLFKKYRKKIK